MIELIEEMVNGPRFIHKDESNKLPNKYNFEFDVCFDTIKGKTYK